MFSFFSIANTAVGKTVGELPCLLPYSRVEADSDIVIDVCNSTVTNTWRKGIFDWAEHVFGNSNNDGLVIDTPVGPSVVRKEMAEIFPQIIDSVNDWPMDENQMLLNEFSTLQWYKWQLEKCTKACYESQDCHATWAYMKVWTGEVARLENYYKELRDAITEDGNMQTWFACHTLNDTYSTKLRGVYGDTDEMHTWTSPIGNGVSSLMTEQEIRAFHDLSTEDYLLASHYWVKPTAGVKYCDEDIDEEREGLDFDEDIDEEREGLDFDVDIDEEERSEMNEKYTTSAASTSTTDMPGGSSTQDNSGKRTTASAASTSPTDKKEEREKREKEEKEEKEREEKEKKEREEKEEREKKEKEKKEREEKEKKEREEREKKEREEREKREREERERREREERERRKREERERRKREKREKRERRKREERERREREERERREREEREEREDIQEEEKTLTL